MIHRCHRSGHRLYFSHPEELILEGPRFLQPGSALGRLCPILIITLCLSFWQSKGGDKKPWDQTDPEEWTLQIAEQVLWESPWVRFTTFKFFGRNQLIYEGRYCVRIQSALPVRLALAESFLVQPDPFVISVDPVDPKKRSEIASQMLLDNELVFSVIGFPPSFHRRLNDQDEAKLRESSYVMAGKRRIALADFAPPNETSFGEAWFRFPRPVLEQTSGKLRFVTVLRVPGKTRIDVTFDISELVFLERLEY